MSKRAAVATVDVTDPLSVAVVSPTNWRDVPIRSEVETVRCIAEAKEKELKILKSQLKETNNLIIKSKNSLNDFSDILEITKTDNLNDSLNEIKKLNNSFNDLTTRYNQMFNSLCHFFLLNPSEVSHDDLIAMLDSPESSRHRRRGAAWSFHV